MEYSQIGSAEKQSYQIKGQINDYCQNFVNTNERPQNFIMNIKPEERFIDYPKLKDLIKLKNELIQKRNHPARYIKANLLNFDFHQLEKFDVIMIDPPYQEYENRVQGLPIFEQTPERFKAWSFDQIASLPIEQIADTPSFLFLWVGSENLDSGRELFKRWGFKRCEDIVWIKTNKENKNQKCRNYNSNSILQRIKEHCLVGLKGDVKRASDSHFIHANIDTDVIVDEEPSFHSTQKPAEIYDIIERFCLGRKRLELFGEIHNIRNGWLTIGQLLPESNFNLQEYKSWFDESQNQDNQQNQGTPSASNDYRHGRYIGTTTEIESLRPKSPKNNQMQSYSGNKSNQAYKNQMNSNQSNIPTQGIIPTNLNNTMYQNSEDFNQFMYSSSQSQQLFQN